MSSRVRKGLQLGLSLGLSLSGCERASVPTTEAPDERPAVVESGELERPAAARPGPARKNTLAQRLADTAVYRDRFARRVLYTWTTRDQIAGLQEHPVLLSRTRSPTRGPARFDRVLRAQSTPMAKLLARPGWDRRRFAWSAPWATLAGWPGESYGDQLVRITLRPEAIMGVFEPEADEPWSFVDLRGGAVDQKTVLQSPERLVAVFHVSAPESPGDGTFFNPGRFREYAIVNERMIEEWAIGTADIAQQLRRDVALLTDLRRHVADTRAAASLPHWTVWSGRVSEEIWNRRPSSADTLDRYAANLAWVNSLYMPSPERLDPLIERLVAAVGAQQSELVHRPDADHLREFWKERTDQAVPALSPARVSPTH